VQTSNVYRAQCNNAENSLHRLKKVDIMKYFKVKEHADQIRIERSRKFWFLVKNELITEGEARKEKFSIEFLKNHFEKVEISKNKTRWFFGCRFEK
jgi:hypothetical protein